MEVRRCGDGEKMEEAWSGWEVIKEVQRGGGDAEMEEWRRCGMDELRSWRWRCGDRGGKMERWGLGDDGRSRWRCPLSIYFGQM